MTQEAGNGAAVTGTEDSLPAGPRRLHTATRKISAEETTLKAAFYLHVERDNDGRVVGARFKTPGKFEDQFIEFFLGVLNGHLEAELGLGWDAGEIVIDARAVLARQRLQQDGKAPADVQAALSGYARTLWTLREIAHQLDHALDDSEEIGGSWVIGSDSAGKPNLEGRRDTDRAEPDSTLIPGPAYRRLFDVLESVDGDGFLHDWLLDEVDPLLTALVGPAPQQEAESAATGTQAVETPADE